MSTEKNHSPADRTSKGPSDGNHPGQDHPGQNRRRQVGGQGHSPADSGDHASRKSKGPASSDRQSRAAAALRDNLARRKAQQRARRDTPAEGLQAKGLQKASDPQED